MTMPREQRDRIIHHGVEGVITWWNYYAENRKLKPLTKQQKERIRRAIEVSLPSDMSDVAEMVEDCA